MQSDYVVRATGKDEVSGMMKNIQKSLEETGKKGSRLDELREKFERITDSTAPLNRKLRQTQALLSQMQFEGLNKSDLFIEMTSAAGSYRDAISDARAAVNAFADDNMKLVAAAQGLQVITGVASIAAGTMGLLGVENDKVQQAMLKVQSAIALCNGVQSVANLLNKDSVLMLRIKQIMTNANTVAIGKNTVAEGANTVATTASTVAKNAWNVAVAIGKALLGDWTGLLLVAAAGLATYAICTSDSTKKQSDINKYVDDGNDIFKSYSDEVANSAGKMVGKYQLLRREWIKTRTEAEKTEWIKNNQKEFESLGLEITNAADAESVFVTNTNNVVKAFEARAKAIAAQNLLVESYTKYYKKLSEIDSTVAGGGMYYKKKAGDEADREELTSVMKKNGAVTKNGDAYNKDNQWYTMKNGKMILTEYGAAMLNVERNTAALQKRNENYDKAQKQLVADTQKATKALEDAQKSLNSLGIKQFKKKETVTKPENKKKDVKKKEEVKVDEKSLKYAEDQLKKLQETRTAQIAVNDVAGLAESEKQIDHWMAEVTKRKAIINVAADAGTLEYAEKKLAELTAEASKNNSVGLDSEIEYWKQHVAERAVEVPIVAKLQDIRKIEDNISTLQDYRITIPVDATEDLRDNEIAIAYWTKQLSQKKIELETYADTRSLEYAKNKVDELNQKLADITTGKITVDESELQKTVSDILFWKKEVEVMTIELDVTVKGSLKEAEEEFAKAKKRLENIDINLITPEELEHAKSEYEKWKKEIENRKISIGLEVKPTEATVSMLKDPDNFAKGSLQDRRQSLSNAQSRADQLKNDVTSGLISKADAFKEIDEINQKLAEIHVPPVKLEFETNVNEVFDTINATIGTFSAIDGVVNSIQNMSKVLEEGGNAWEQFMAVIQIVMSVFQTVQTVMTAFQTVQALCNSLTTASTAALTAEAAATTSKATAEGAAIGTAVGLTAATKAEEAAFLDLAAAKMMAAAAGTLGIGTAAAVAEIAAMMAAMTAQHAASKALAAFATGGIVKGTSYHGDREVVRVNAGEMILTKSQQSALFKTLKNGAGLNTNNSNHQVEFKISGTTLKGVLDNYNNKVNRFK